MQPVAAVLTPAGDGEERRAGAQAEPGGHRAEGHHAAAVGHVHGGAALRQVGEDGDEAVAAQGADQAEGGVVRLVDLHPVGAPRPHHQVGDRLRAGGGHHRGEVEVDGEGQVGGHVPVAEVGQGEDASPTGGARRGGAGHRAAHRAAVAQRLLRPEAAGPDEVDATAGELAERSSGAPSRLALADAGVEPAMVAHRVAAAPSGDRPADHAQAVGQRVARRAEGADQRGRGLQADLERRGGMRLDAAHAPPRAAGRLSRTR